MKNYFKRKYAGMLDLKKERLYETLSYHIIFIKIKMKINALAS